jgi:hypothetical protein
MHNFQEAKQVVQNFYAAFDRAADADLTTVLQQYTTPHYHWRGMHPFYEQQGAAAVVETFWKPFRAAFSPVQRREDIFFAGANECDGGQTQWVIFWGFLTKTGLGFLPRAKWFFFATPNLTALLPTEK